MSNTVVALVIALIVALSIYKIVAEKRKGSKCVGCASGNSCTSPKKPTNK